jgi:hypothetical protein
MPPKKLFSKSTLLSGKMDKVHEISGFMNNLARWHF